jgi:hypothetical protein
LNINLWSEIRSQLLEHITTKFLRTKTIAFTDLDPRDVTMSPESEQVLPKNLLTTKKGNNTSSVDLP